MRDRYERRHRRTPRHPASVAFMAGQEMGALLDQMDALFDDAPVYLGPAGPQNLVAVIRGHYVFSDDRSGKRLFHLFTPGTGWWGFDIADEAYARRVCEFVAPLASAPGVSPQEGR